MYFVFFSSYLIFFFFPIFAQCLIPFLISAIPPPAEMIKNWQTWEKKVLQLHFLNILTLRVYSHGQNVKKINNAVVCPYNGILENQEHWKHASPLYFSPDIFMILFFIRVIDTWKITLVLTGKRKIILEWKYTLLSFWLRTKKAYCGEKSWWWCDIRGQKNSTETWCPTTSGFQDWKTDHSDNSDHYTPWYCDLFLNC